MKRLLLLLTPIFLLAVSVPSIANARCYGYPYYECVHYYHPYHHYYHRVYYRPYYYHHYYHDGPYYPRPYYPAGPMIVVRP